MRIRAACHIHSNWSYDGKWTLRQLASLFGHLGYRAVLLTEHDRGFDHSRYEAYRHACREASRPDVLLIPGIEYSNRENTVHILAWGDMPFLGEGLATEDLLQAVKRHQGVCVLAHPSRKNAWKLYRDGWAGHLAGVEVWNRKTDAWAPSIDAIRIIEKSGLRAFVGLDFHRAKQLFPFSLTVELAQPIDEPSLLEQIRSGRFKSRAFGVSEDRFRQKHLLAFLLRVNALRNLLARAYHKYRFQRTSPAVENE